MIMANQEFEFGTLFLDDDEVDEEETEDEEEGVIPIEESPYKRAPTELVEGDDYAGVRWLNRQVSVKTDEGDNVYQVQWPGNTVPKDMDIKKVGMEHVGWARLKKDGKLVSDDNQIIPVIHREGDTGLTVIGEEYYSKVFSHAFTAVKELLKKGESIPEDLKSGYITISYQRRPTQREQLSCNGADHTVGRTVFSVPYASPSYWNALMDAYNEKMAKKTQTGKKAASQNKQPGPEKKGRVPKEKKQSEPEKMVKKKPKEKKQAESEKETKTKKSQRSTQAACAGAAAAWGGDKKEYRKDALEELKQLADDDEEDDEDYQQTGSEEEEQNDTEDMTEDVDDDDDDDSFVVKEKMEASVSKCQLAYAKYHSLPETRHKPVNGARQLNITDPVQTKTSVKKNEEATDEGMEIEEEDNTEEETPVPRKRKRGKAEEAKQEKKPVSRKKKKSETAVDRVEKPAPRKRNKMLLDKEEEEEEVERAAPRKRKRNKTLLHEEEEKEDDRVEKPAPKKKEEDTDDGGEDEEDENQTEGFNRKKQKRNAEFVKYMKTKVSEYRKKNKKLLPDIFANVDAKTLYQPKTEEEVMNKQRFDIIMCYLCHYASPSNSFSLLPKRRPKPKPVKKFKLNPLDVGVDI